MKAPHRQVPREPATLSIASMAARATLDGASASLSAAIATEPEPLVLAVFRRAADEGWADVAAEVVGTCKATWSDVALLSCLIRSLPRGWNRAPRLHGAARAGDAARMRRFVELGADVHARDGFGGSAMAGAAARGRDDVVAELASLGATLCKALTSDSACVKLRGHT